MAGRILMGVMNPMYFRKVWPAEAAIGHCMVFGHTPSQQPLGACFWCGCSLLYVYRVPRIASLPLTTPGLPRQPAAS